MRLLRATCCWTKYSLSVASAFLQRLGARRVPKTHKRTQRVKIFFFSFLVRTKFNLRFRCHLESKHKKTSPPQKWKKLRTPCADPRQKAKDSFVPIARPLFGSTVQCVASDISSMTRILNALQGGASCVKILSSPRQNLRHTRNNITAKIFVPSATTFI